MLSATVVALRARGAHVEALEVGRKALAMPPDHSYSLHRLWVALDETLEGDAEAGRAAVREIDPDALNSYYKSLRHLLRAAVDLSVEPLQAATAVLPAYRLEAALVRSWVRVVGRIGRAQGGFKGFWTRLRYSP